MEYLDLAIDPQSALERAYPRWRAWQAQDGGEWWATVKANLTKRELAAGCESYRSAETPGRLAELLDAEDTKAGVSRTPVRLVAWGTDNDHLRRAYGDFALHPVRPLWRIVDATSSIGAPCPFSVNDSAVITAHAGDDWAYGVYPAAHGGVQS